MAPAHLQSAGPSQIGVGPRPTRPEAHSATVTACRSRPRFMDFFHNNIVDLPTNIVLLGSNRNRIGSMGRARCTSSGLISTGVRIGASVSEMTLLPISKTPPFSLQHV
jgi:hypothetical protein